MSLTGVGLGLTIDGVEYTFSPLTFEDFEWLELRMKARAIEAGRLSIPENASREQRDEAMAQVFNHAEKISILDNFDRMFTPYGVVTLLHRMLSKKHPQLTAAQVAAWAQDPNTMDELMSKLQLLAPSAKKNVSPRRPLAKGRKKSR